MQQKYKDDNLLSSFSKENCKYGRWPQTVASTWAAPLIGEVGSERPCTRIRESLYQDQRGLVPGSERPCTRIREALYQDQRVLVPVCDFVYCLHQTARLSGRRDHAETPGDDNIFVTWKMFTVCIKLQDSQADMTMQKHLVMIVIFVTWKVFTVCIKLQDCQADVIMQKHLVMIVICVTWKAQFSHFVNNLMSVLQTVSNMHACVSCAKHVQHIRCLWRAACHVPRSVKGQVRVHTLF